MSALSEYLKLRHELEIKHTRIRFEKRIPKIGEYAILFHEKNADYIQRTSQNFYHSYGFYGSTMMEVRESDVCVTFVSDKIEKPDAKMKTTADALRWTIKVIENERVNVAFRVAMQKEFAEVKRILARAEFAGSDEAPNYTVDGGFKPEKAE